MTEHRIVGVAIATDSNCGTCSPTSPHNVIARCACGQSACGKTPHIWTLTRQDGLVTLQPSFNWLVDPNDAGRGSHLHEFVTGIPLKKLGELFGDVLDGAEGGAL